MRFKTILKAVLNLFDGEGGAPVGETNTSEAATQTETNADVVANTDANAEDSAQQNEVRDKVKDFKNLIDGEYKDEFTKATQDIINRRFKETKNLQKQVDTQKPILDMLMQRYNVEDIDGLRTALDNDHGYWEQAAYEAGYDDVEKFKEVQNLRRENKSLMEAERQRQIQQAQNEQLAKWESEAKQFAQKNPKFDFQKECQNQNFLDMIGKGLPIEYAYNALHYNDDVNDAIKSTAKSAEKKIVDDIRARGMRPSENGMSSNKAIDTSKDIHKLSLQQMQEMVRRARGGENINFR